MTYKFHVSVNWELEDIPGPQAEDERRLGWKSFYVEHTRRYPTEKQLLDCAARNGAGENNLTLVSFIQVPDFFSDKPAVDLIAPPAPEPKEDPPRK